MTTQKKQSAAEKIKELLESTEASTRPKAIDKPKKEEPKHIADQDRDAIVQQSTKNLPPQSNTPPTEKVKTAEEIKPPKQNGGARPGAGRKPGGTALQKRLMRTLLAEHFSEKIKVKVTDPKTGKQHVIEKPRVLVAIDTLFHIGIDTKNDAALDKWLNRALGKAPQPLIGDEEEDPIRIDLGVERILKKAYGLPEDGEDDE